MATSLVLVTFDWFSIPLLLRTLFAPWKRDVVSPTYQEIQLVLQAFAFNIISRFFGFIIRSVTVAVGAFVTAVVALSVASVVVLAFGLPVLGPVGFIVGLVLLTDEGLKPIGTAFIALLAGAIGGILYWFSHEMRENPPLPEPLDQAIRREDFVFRPYFRASARRVVEDANDLGAVAYNLFKSREASFIFSHLDLGPQELVSELPASVDSRTFVKTAATIAIKQHHSRVEVADLVLALIHLSPTLQKKLPDKKLTLPDVEAVCRWQVELWQQLSEPSALLNPREIRSTGGVGRDWASGWTPTLDAFSVDWSAAREGRHPAHHFLAHRASIEALERVMARVSHHNAMIVGEPGTGKRTAVVGLVEKILRTGSYANLAFKRVVELDINRLLSQASSFGALEELLVQIFNEALHAGNIIVFIDEIDRLLFADQTAVGRVDAGAVILPYLASPDLKLIATTTPSSWHKILSYNQPVAASFEKIEVAEPSDAEMLKVLEEVGVAFELSYRVTITYAALKEAIALSRRFLPDKKLPEKAIDLLDEAAVAVAEKSPHSIVRPQDLDELVEQKTKVAVGPVGVEESKVLLNLEQVLHAKLINQDYAVSQLADALRRARAGVRSRAKPIGTFLFLGPTGVGKTQTAKVLAEAYFGSEQQIIRFDMSEYDTPFGLERLIGGPSHADGGLLTKAVHDKPFSLLLFDEIDKADDNVLNLFLQLLDEGRLTDAEGRTVDFTNTLVIATSNAGSEFIRQQIEGGQKVEQFAKALVDEVQRQGIFRPEFLNRFDAVVVYRPLMEAEMVKVLDVMVTRLNEQMAKEQIKIVLDGVAKEKLVKLGFDPVFGARALERALQEKVENLVAEKILKQELKPGMSFTVTGAMV